MRGVKNSIRAETFNLLNTKNHTQMGIWRKCLRCLAEVFAEVFGRSALGDD